MPENDWTTPLRFTLSEELVVKAAKLAASRYQLQFLCFALVVGLLTSAFFLFSRPKWNLERELLQTFLIVASAVAMGLLILGLMRWWVYPSQARKNFRQQKALSEDMSFSWTDTEFRYATGKSRTEMPLENLHGYRASDEIIILYLSDAIYHAIPVDTFGGSEAHAAFMRQLEKAGLRRL
jgi:uncharacterized membrane protein YidH (DUF202 family)